MKLQPAGLKSAIAIVQSTTGGHVVVSAKNAFYCELDDIVAFIREGEKGASAVTGFGRVEQVYPDSIITTKNSIKDGVEPAPGDRAYVISRDDSPFSRVRSSR